MNFPVSEKSYSNQS